MALLGEILNKLRRQRPLQTTGSSYRADPSNDDVINARYHLTEAGIFGARQKVSRAAFHNFCKAGCAPRFLGRASLVMSAAYPSFKHTLLLQPEEVMACLRSPPTNEISPLDPCSWRRFPRFSIGLIVSNVVI